MRTLKLSILALVLLVGAAHAQLGVGINHDTTLLGTGSTGSPLRVNSTTVQSRVTGTCTGNDAILSIASDGTVTCATGTGDITSVVAGTGLSGGAPNGAATLTLAINGNVTQSCSAGNAVTSLTGVGITTCSAFSTSSSTTTAINAAVSGTTNATAKFTGTNVVGNGWALDDGTTWGVANKFAITEATGATAIAGTLTDTTAIGTTFIGAAGQGNLKLYDTTSMAAGVGGQITFFGNYTGTTPVVAGAIKAMKTNGTAGNYSFDLVFGTIVNGNGDIAERMRLSDTGLLTVGAGVTTPANLTTTGTGALVVAGTGSVASNLGVATSTGKGLFSVASTTAHVSTSGFTGFTTWDNRYSTFGPNVGSTTGAALGLGYSTVDDAANVVSIAPNTGWKPIRIVGLSDEFWIGGTSGAQLTVTSTGTTVAAALSQTAGNVSLNTSSGTTGIGTTPVSTAKLSVATSTAGVNGVVSSNAGVNLGNDASLVKGDGSTWSFNLSSFAVHTGYGVYGESSARGPAASIGCGGPCYTSAGQMFNVGVYGKAAGAEGADNIGGRFTAVNGSTNTAIKTDDGDVWLNYTSGVTTIGPTGGTNTQLTVNGNTVTNGALNGYTQVTKVSDQDVTNSTTLTDDTSLTFAVTAAKAYAVEFYLWVSGSNASDDYQFRLATSAGTLDGTGECVSVSTADAIQTTAVIATAAANTNTVTVGTRANSGIPIAVHCTYSFLQNTSSGNFKLQFSNVVAGVGVVSRTMAGSYLRWKQLN